MSDEAHISGAPGTPDGPVRTIRLRCPNLSCRSILAVPEEARGKVVRCRICHMTIKVPLRSQHDKAA